MNPNDLFDATQTIISAELLATLEWLAMHEESLLQDLLEQAIQHGLQKKIQAIQKQPTTDPADLLGSMTLFLDTFEELLHKMIAKNTTQPKNSIQSAGGLTEVVEAIDCSSCDANVIPNSIAKTNQALRRNKKENPRKLFFKEFLKNWKPTKKNSIQ